MLKINKKLTQLTGIIGTVACISVFALRPSFPTPDKLLVFFILLFMAIGQGWSLFKRMAPFVAVILVYESFRSLAHQLNSHVNYTFAPHIDKLLFGALPTASLQHWLWRGHVQWYDVILYIPYLIFFLAPMVLAIIIWKTRDDFYWHAVTSYSLLFFLSFFTFLVFPAAPPWLASQNHFIQPITRISSYVWASIGINNFPSVYNHLSPNPVAAFPSLHSGASTLFSILVFKLYGWRWGVLSLLYPVLIYIGVVYEGEHYVTDVIAGIIYAFASYWLASKVYPWLAAKAAKLKSNHSSSTKNALKSAQ